MVSPAYLFYRPAKPHFQLILYPVSIFLKEKKKPSLSNAENLDYRIAIINESGFGFFVVSVCAKAIDLNESGFGFLVVSACTKAIVPNESGLGFFVVSVCEMTTDRDELCETPTLVNAKRPMQALAVNKNCFIQKVLSVIKNTTRGRG